MTHDPERAHEVRTVVMPQYEVPVTETPGLRPEDRPAMREMVEKGHLDMEVLAEMDRSELVAVLSVLASDYGKWIDEQKSRIGADVVGHDITGCRGSRSLQRISRSASKKALPFWPMPATTRLWRRFVLRIVRWRSSASTACSRSRSVAAKTRRWPISSSEESLVATVSARLHPALDSVSGRSDPQRPHQADRSLRRFALVPDGRRQDRSLSGRRRLRDGHSPSSGAIWAAMTAVAV